MNAEGIGEHIFLKVAVSRRDTLTHMIEQNRTTISLAIFAKVTTFRLLAESANQENADENR